MTGEITRCRDYRPAASKERRCDDCLRLNPPRSWRLEPAVVRLSTPPSSEVMETWASFNISWRPLSCSNTPCSTLFLLGHPHHWSQHSLSTRIFHEWVLKPFNIDGKMQYSAAGTAYVVSAWFLVLVEFIILGIRLYSRTLLTRSVGSDDFFIVIGVVCRFFPPTTGASKS